MQKSVHETEKTLKIGHYFMSGSGRVWRRHLEVLIVFLSVLFWASAHIPNSEGSFLGSVTSISLHFLYTGVWFVFVFKIVRYNWKKAIQQAVSNENGVKDEISVSYVATKENGRTQYTEQTNCRNRNLV